MFELTAQQSLREQIAESLRAAIITGEMTAEVLYSVPSLAEKFGVSITPVREAMLDLANEGLVEPVKNKGFRLRTLSDKQLDDITSVRLLLEPAAVAELTGRLSENDVQRLIELSHKIIETAKAGSLTEYVNYDRAFHRALLELGGNAALTDIVMSLRAQSRLLGLAELAARGTLHETAHEHDELIAALQGDDSEKVAEIVRHHLSHVRREWA
jgi:DNA-binding GntR family transcriptional regulator